MQNHYTELQSQYKTWLKTLGFSSHTVVGYPQMLTHFFKYIQNKGVYTITHLNPKHVSDYFNHLQMRSNMRVSGKALSKAHLNKHFEAVDKFLEFLHQNGMNKAPQPTKYRLTDFKTEPSVKAFTKKEIQTLYTACDTLFQNLSYQEATPRKALARLILDLCYGCGLRKSELFNLLLDDIDLNKKVLFIRQAKGNKDRFVPLSDTLTKRITEFIYHHRKDFKTSSKNLFPLSFHSLAYYFKIILKHSSLKCPTGTGLHTLRHSIATHLLQNGMSIEQIARFLGHSTLESTQVYTHLIPEK